VHGCPVGPSFMKKKKKKRERERNTQTAVKFQVKSE
jgi:hypothetical protein